MRLIDADALPHYDGTALSAVEVARAVIYAPTIEERKKGKWIKRGRMVQCSECGRFTTVQENYCPSCGSYNGEENENGNVQ